MKFLKGRFHAITCLFVCTILCLILVSVVSSHPVGGVINSDGSPSKMTEEDAELIHREKERMKREQEAIEAEIAAIAERERAMQGQP